MSDDTRETLYLGEDRSLVVTVLGTDGTAEDISGWTLSWMVKRALGDTDPEAVLTKTTSDGIALTTPGSGICTISVADTDTDSLAPRLYIHELKRMDAGAETVLFQRRLSLKRGVHRT